MKTIFRATTYRGKDLDQSMIPAINIVFLLLIFFMIAGQIETTTGQLVLPESFSDVNASANLIEIHIDANGDYYLNRKKISGSLQQALEAQPLSSETVIICHAHADLPASVLDPVLHSIRTLGLTRLQLATKWKT